jgi:bidirectional [NiFe] hydrogenase diaphorase subunit
MVCVAGGCLACGSNEVRHAISGAIVDAGKQERIEVSGTGCLGLCSRGPLVRSVKHDCLYSRVDPTDAPRLVTNRISEDLAAGGILASHPF